MQQGWGPQQQQQGGWGPPPQGGYGAPYGTQPGYPQPPPQGGGFPWVGCLIGAGVFVFLVGIVGAGAVLVLGRASAPSSYSPPTPVTAAPAFATASPDPAPTPTASWSKFTSKAGSYTVLFPVEPTEQKGTMESPAGPVVTDTAMAQDGIVFYGVSYVNLGSAVVVDKNKVLDGAR